MRRKDWADYTVERVADKLQEELLNEDLLKAFATELRRAYFRGLTHDFVKFFRETHFRNERQYDYCESKPRVVTAVELGEILLQEGWRNADYDETWVDTALAKKADEP
jgi:HD superfamily phosphohydrolase YqeK